jgi:hypothetical protein
MMGFALLNPSYALSVWSRLKDCQNYLIHFFGPAIRKTASLFYEFHLSQYPKSAFRELDGLTRAIFDDVIVHAP